MEKHRQLDEVRGGRSYISRNDLRIPFGIGAATQAYIEVRWRSGQVEKSPGVAANRIYAAVEGKGLKSRCPS